MKDFKCIKALWNIGLRCITLVYAVEYLFTDTKMCCILLCYICSTLKSCVSLPV